MRNDKIQIKEVFKEGWKLTTENMGFLCGYGAIVLALSWLIKYSILMAPHSILIPLTLSTILLLIQLGLYRSAILILKGEKPQFDQLYSNWKLLGRCIFLGFLFLVLMVILTLMIIIQTILISKNIEFSKETATMFQIPIVVFGIGALAACIPIIWLFIRLNLVFFFIVDKNSSAIKSLKESYRATRGNIWPLSKIILVLGLFNLLNWLTYEITMIITLPFLLMVNAIVYRVLTSSEVEIIRAEELAG